MQPKTDTTIIIVGANRGLGLGLVREYLSRGWNVVATARRPDQPHELLALLGKHPDRLQVETLDVTDVGSAHALALDLADRRADLLFVVAGASSHHAAPIHAAPPDAAAKEFLTNAYGPLTVAEALIPALDTKAPVAFMTSVLGSLANASGGMELYRATKAALNMLAIGFSYRHADRRVVLMHPGWVKTDMGGSQAPLDLPTSARGMADTLAKVSAGKGVVYVDYAGEKIAW